MGRKKKYVTEEEKLAAQAKWAAEYYFRNKERLQKKNLDNYYRRKNVCESEKMS